MCSIEKKQGTYRHEEYSSEERSCLQGRRGGISSQGNISKRISDYAHTGYTFLPSKLKDDDDGNVEMSDTHEDSKIRYTPYTMQHQRRGKQRKEDQIHFTVWKDIKPQEIEIGQNVQDKSTESWFKVTIPCGRKTDKTKLMKSIQDLCNVPFTPVDLHYDRNRIRFFVQCANNTATALKNISSKIHDEESRKICIFVNPSDVPYSVQNKLTPEQMEQLKLAMRKRYDVSHQALDLQRLRFDPDLLGHDIDMVLNRRSCMVATLQIIQENFPEILSLNLRNNKLYRLDSLFDMVVKAPQVKILNLSKNELQSAWELEKLKDLNLEELWLEGNPLCSTFSSESSYVSAVRDCFPKLLYLDGRKLPPLSPMDIDTPQLLQPCKESLKESESIKELVLQFLQEYSLIYDYGDRHGLLSAYHDEACFSLTIPFNPSDPDQSSFCEYFKHGSDMKKPRDTYRQRQLLKYKKHDIVDCLCVFPKTQHDFSSFRVVMCFQTKTMLCFSVNGAFKEVEGKTQGRFRAFTRTFITIPGNNSSSMCIVNDQLFLRDSSPDEIQSAFANSVPTPCISSNPILSLEQRRMVRTFSTQSGMKLEWSQKCLEDNKWNYTRAAEVFSMLQTEGKIPKEFFKQMS